MFKKKKTIIIILVIIVIILLDVPQLVRIEIKSILKRNITKYIVEKEKVSRDKIVIQIEKEEDNVIIIVYSIDNMVKLIAFQKMDNGKYLERVASESTGHYKLVSIPNNKYHMVALYGKNDNMYKEFRVRSKGDKILINKKIEQGYFCEITTNKSPDPKDDFLEFSIK